MQMHRDPGAEPLLSGLADHLRAATRSAHVLAERAAMQHLYNSAVLTARRYGLYLHAMHAVYSALEQQLSAHCEHPLLAPIHHPVLHRTEALAADLNVLLGPGWTLVPATAAGRAYADSVQRAAARDPVLLLAYSYTRYLGDLSGGQVVKCLVQQQLGLQGDDGLRALLFPGIADVGGFRLEFRACFNALQLPAALREAVVAEALSSFRLTQAVLESLEATEQNLAGARAEG